MRYALATIRRHGRPTPVIEVGGACHDLAALASRLCANAYGQGLMALFADWAGSRMLGPGPREPWRGKCRAKAYLRTVARARPVSPLMRRSDCPAATQRRTSS